MLHRQIFTGLHKLSALQIHHHAFMVFRLAAKPSLDLLVLVVCGECYFRHGERALIGNLSNNFLSSIYLGDGTLHLRK